MILPISRPSTVIRCFIALWTVTLLQAQIIIRGNGVVRMQGGNVIIQGNDQASLSLEPETPLRYPRLTWKNGEQVEGQLIGAGDETLTWQIEGPTQNMRAPWFAEPVTLRSRAVERLDFPTSSQLVSEENFAITLINGDRLYSDIRSIAGESLLLDSKRHGELRLPMASIHSISRLKDSGLVYAGPAGLAGWTAVESGRAGSPPALNTGHGGTLVMTSWNRSARLNLSMPKQAEIRLKLASTSRLQFSLGLTQQVESLLETWQDELVAVWNNTFAPIRTLTEVDRELALRLTLDAATGQFKVHDWNGQLLGQITLPQNMNYPGILLKNMGRNLTLQHLSVRAWDGLDLVKLPAGEGYAEHMNGSSITGLLVPSDSATDLRLHSTSGDQVLPLAQLRSYQRTTVQPAQKQNLSQLRYSDGACITGDLLGMRAGAVQQRIAGLDNPLSSQLEGVVRMVIAEGEWQQQERTDVLQFDRERAVTGTLKGSTDGQLLWQLQAADKPVALAPGLRGWEILRKQQSVSSDASALFFLRDGQVFPGELRGLNEHGVQLATPVAETKEISHQDLNAVHFKTTQSQVGALGSDGWQFLNEQDQHSKAVDGKLTLLGDARYGHPRALMGDELNFSINMPESWGAVAVRLFIEDLNGNGSHAAQIHFMQSSRDMWCAVEGQEGSQRQSEQLRNAPPGKITIQMLMDDTNIQILANGKSLLNAALSLDQRKGLGIMFGPSSMWGNGQQRRVEVSDFSVRSRPEFVPVPHVTSSHKEQVLSIPRFRRESPPTHAILAPNGDLLSGRIETVSSTGLRFSSGLESLELPFSRLASAIWLQKPLDKRPSTSAAAAQRVEPFVPSHWVLLNDGSRLALTLDRVMPTELQGWCPSLGDCRIGLERVIQLTTQELTPTMAMKAYQNWQLVYAAEPVLAESGGQSSPMLGKDTPQYVVRLLEGGTASAKGELGKVVVLDFWATWCGPCVKSLPKTVELMKQFDPTQVHFIAVNQGETDEQVKIFMQARGLQMSVGMDLAQAMGKAFGVEGIPHQVVINRTGKMVWVNTGAGEEEKLMAAIRTALQEGQ